MLFSINLNYRPKAEDYEDYDPEAEAEIDEFETIPLVHWVIDEPSLDEVLEKLDRVRTRLKEYAVAAAVAGALLSDEESPEELMKQIEVTVDPCAIHTFERILIELEELTR